MSNTQEFIDNFLSHYSSEYYDPVKAREYYLRTRELKGRRSGANLRTDKQKEAWNYVKDKITTERQELIKETGNELRGDIAIMRENTAKHRKALSEKLSFLIKKVSEHRRSESQRFSELKAKEAKRISEEASRKIDALPPIPKGISAERRAKLTAQRSEEIAKIRGTADKQRETLATDISKKRTTLSKWVEADKTKNRQRTSKEREAVGVLLKDAVERGRAGYEKAKERIKAQYEEKLDKEYEAIKQNV